MFGDMNGGGFGDRPWGAHEPYRPPYVPPPEVWGGGGYPSSGPSSPTPKSTTETSQSKTEVPLVVVLFVLGLAVVVPIGCVIWMLVQVFDF